MCSGIEHKRAHAFESLHPPPVRQLPPLPISPSGRSRHTTSANIHFGHGSLRRICKAKEMSLVAGRGPLSKDPAGRFSSPLPGDLVFVEPHPRRVQALRNGRVAIDTERALMVHRRDHPLSYAFPADEGRDLPCSPEPQAPGYVQVPWDAVDTWLEEGR